MLHHPRLRPVVTHAATLLATVVRQHLQTPHHHSFPITPRVTKHPVISTVDPHTRHPHKTTTRHFHPYKRHIPIHPHTELITATPVTTRHTRHTSVTAELIPHVMTIPPSVTHATPHLLPNAAIPVVYRHNTYATHAFQHPLHDAPITSTRKTQPPVPRDTPLAKHPFTVHLENERVTHPPRVTVVIHRHQHPPVR